MLYKFWNRELPNEMAEYPEVTTKLPSMQSYQEEALIE
jgi:hypothetical protein